MRVKIEKPPNSLSPDVAICEHCKQRIEWDEICYVHENGFADCGLVISGGTRAGGCLINPEMTVTDPLKRLAEPTTWYKDVE